MTARYLGKTADLLEHLDGHHHARSISDLERTLNETSFRLLVFGEFNVGKSTLINALLGRQVLPAKTRPTTSHSTYIYQGDRDEVRVVFTDGREHHCDLAGINEFAVLDFNSRAREGIARLEVRVSSPLLDKGLTVIDTPGVNDTEAQTLRAEQAVMQADMVLFVLNANQLLAMSDRKLAVRWMARDLGKPIVPVLNYMNQVDDGERADVRRILDKWARTNITPTPVLGKPYFEVNAIGALRHSLGTPGAERPLDDFFALKSLLEQLMKGPAAELKCKSRRNQLRYTVKQVVDWNSKLVERLRRDSERVQAERSEEFIRLKSARERIERDARRERMHVLVEAGRILERGFNELAGKMKGQRKEVLEWSARSWLDSSILVAAGSVEATARDALNDLASHDAPLPEPLTITQLLTLDMRTNVVVGEINMRYVIDGVGIAGGLGGAISGLMIAGPVGAVVGFWLGGQIGERLANTLPAKLPLIKTNYAKAYTKAAEQDWGKLTEKAKSALGTQFDARVAELSGWIDERTKSLAQVKGENQELSMRTQLAQQLDSLLH